MTIAFKNQRMTTAPGLLCDDQLFLRSVEWRCYATYGDKNAQAQAQAKAHEAEVRRRFTADAPTECGTLEQAPVQHRSGWRLW